MLTDLLILGAGPSGCAAAIAGLQSGMSVTLLEKFSSPQSNPGETLHPGIEPIFKQLGVWESVTRSNFHRHRGIWRESVDGIRVFESYGKDKQGEWLGFQVDRSRLNEVLRARVIELGGEIVAMKRLENVQKERSVVAGIYADKRVLGAQYVLDATGRHSFLARHLKLVARKPTSEQRLLFGWIDETPDELDGQPLFQRRKDGWDWIAPLGDGRCSWTRLRRESAKDGIDYTWRLYRECAGPGYFLLGDAASLMDPSAANGVLRALMSGIYAVHLIASVGRDSECSKEIADEYKSWIETLFDFSLSASQEHSAPQAWLPTTV